MNTEVKKRPELFLPPPPKFLTRFYGNIEFGRDVFVTKTIAFVHVALMNDPFDPYFEFVNDFGDRYRAVVRWINVTHGPKEVRWFKSIMPYDSWVNIIKDIKQKNQHLKSAMFLFCASAPSGAVDPSQNLYMWGHYCSGHNGLAIEFNSDIVASSILAHQVQLNPKWSRELKLWTPVIYQDKIDGLTPEDLYDFLKAPAAAALDTRLAMHFNTLSRTKSTVWQPEQEWRLLWQNDEVVPKTYKVPLLPSAVRRVFIGLRVADKLAIQVAAECHAAFPGAEVLKGAARPGEFALDFRVIP